MSSAVKAVLIDMPVALRTARSPRGNLPRSSLRPKVTGTRALKRLSCQQPWRERSKTGHPRSRWVLRRSGPRRGAAAVVCQPQHLQAEVHAQQDVKPAERQTAAVREDGVPDGAVGPDRAETSRAPSTRLASPLFSTGQQWDRYPSPRVHLMREKIAMRADGSETGERIVHS